MYIELISKACVWKGDNGVVMNIKALAYPCNTASLSPQDALNTRSVQRQVGITISGLGEVSVYDINSSTPNFLDMSSLDQVEEWVEGKGLLSEWREETTKYISALSRVDLPHPSSCVGRNYLLYNLKLRDGGASDDYTSDIAITVQLRVDVEGAILVVGLSREDLYESLDLCTINITGPITIDTVKTVVSKQLDRLLGLVVLPLIDADNTFN